MRKVFLAVLGILLIVGSVVMAKRMIANKKVHQSHKENSLAVATVKRVANSDLPVTINVSGKLAARKRVDIYAEVQGVLTIATRGFYEGTHYRKGELMLGINSDEFAANLKAQKSNLLTRIISIMPDLQLDFPASAGKWEAYVNQFDVNAPLRPLPETSSLKEKYFITGKGIYSLYYQINNLQIRLAKYNIYAPFSGTLIRSFVDKGTLIRPGMKLGEFISPAIYELETTVNTSYAGLLTIGKSVTLKNIEGDKSWTGKIARINDVVDPKTQSIKIYIQVSGKGLKEGMFLQANISGKRIEHAFEIDRSLLVEDKFVFTVADSVLHTKPVTPVYFNEKTAIVKGLEDGTVILAKPIPDAYDGMVVKVQ